MSHISDNCTDRASQDAVTAPIQVPVFCGSRKIARELRDRRMDVGRLHVTTAMRRMGIRMDGKGRCIDNMFIERLWHRVL